MSEPVSDLLEAERRVAAVIESSVLIELLARPLGHLRHAAASSRVAMVAARIATEWTRLTTGEQRFAGGVALLAAVAVHLGLTVWHEIPAGWLWLMVPGTVTAAGCILLLASGLPSDHGSEP